jgi:hypothetical protein
LKKKIKPLEFNGDTISISVSITEKDFELFNSEKIETVLSLFQPIMGYVYTGKLDALSLGEELKKSKVLSFLEQSLKEVKDFGKLAADYKEVLRPDTDLKSLAN